MLVSPLKSNVPLYVSLRLAATGNFGNPELEAVFQPSVSDWLFQLINPVGPGADATPVPLIYSFKSAIRLPLAGHQVASKLSKPIE